MSVSQNPWLSQLPRYSLLRNDDRKQALTKEGRPIFDFGIGDPLEETPAFIREALVKGITKTSQYPSAIGSLDFRNGCASWVKRRFQVDLNATSQVISSNGSKESVFHIPQVLFNASSERRIVVFPDPGYPVYKSSTILSGGIPYEAALKPEKKYVFDPREIPSELLPYIAATWVCYPHNPTGALIAKNEMEDIYSWALANNIVLLSDECYVDMYFPGSPKPESFLQIAEAENFRNLLCFFSLSKRSGMTGYRSGFVAGDASLIAAYAKYRPNAGLGTPEFVQRAAIAAWNDDAHVVERNTIFAAKRKLMESFLKRRGMDFLDSTATFYVWVKAPASYSTAEDFVDALAKTTGIIATPGDALGNSCETWFRLALVPTAEQMVECLGRWDAAIERGDVRCQ